MITITVENSYSKITGLTPAQEKELRKELSYVVGGSSAYFSGYGPRHKSLLSKKNEFPTGLLNRVINYFPDLKKVSLIDNTIQPKLGTSLKIKGLIPRKDQEYAALVATRLHRGIISMVTASGKSLVIALIASRLNVKTLVIVPTLGLKEQLTKSLLEALGPNHKVVVENIDSSTLPGLTDFDCLIIDEAHHAAAKTYQRLNRTAWKGIYYRYFFTATPFRNDDEEQLLFEAIAGQVIYELDYKTAVEKKIIPPIDAYYIEISKQETDAFTWKEVYSKLVVNNAARNKIIRYLVRNISKDYSILCLVKEIAHGNKLIFPFANGQSDTTPALIQAFNEKRIKALVGTIGVLGEGIDTRPAEYVIIAGLGKAKSTFMQNIGRVLRPYPGKESGKVILIKDRSHKFTVRHFNFQVKYLKEVYGVKPIKLEI